MAGIATATLAYPGLALWLGVGLWGLLTLCVGGILLTALTGRTTDVLPHAATESHTPPYQRAA